MQWRSILFLSLLCAACGTGPVDNFFDCVDTTSFSVSYTSELTAKGRFDHYVITAVLASTTPCYSVDGGSVYVNGTPLLIVPGEGGPSYRITDTTFATIPLRFDGTAERFVVSGNANFPATIDSIQSSLGETEIISPTPFDSVPRTSDLVIEWTPSGNETDSIEMWACDPANYGYQGRGALLYHIRDNGKHIVPAKELSHIPSGQLLVYMTRVRSRKGTLPDGRPSSIEIVSRFRLVTNLR